MDLQLSGQGVVVLGGGSGIGRAIAAAFAAEGARVGVFDRSLRCSKWPADLQVEYVVGDVADYDSVQSAAAEFEDKLDGVRHVICAAGIGSGKFGFPFWNLEPADWPRVLEVNIMGMVHTAHAFEPGLREAGTGTFLFLTSVAAQIGSPTDPPYSAAKAAVINFMQVMAKDLAPHNVRANCLSPGMVKTPLNESVWAAGQEQLPEAERQSYEDWAAAKIKTIAPLGRWQQPAEFGAMAAYLASPHARNITGQTINIDGGQVMHA